LSQPSCSGKNPTWPGDRKTARPAINFGIKPGLRRSLAISLRRVR
jgi:hypothetical protein